MKLQKYCCLIVCVVAGLVVPALAGFDHSAQALMGKITLQSGGQSRTALFIEHERLKKARRPVIVILPGGKSSGNRMRRHLGFGEIARASGAVLVYPDPVDGQWSDASGPRADKDMQFIVDLINRLVSDGIADRRRIFIAGIGSGGLMAMRLACVHSDVLAGAAAVLAGLPADLAQTCHPTRPIRFILIAGTADPLVPFHGGKANLPGSNAELLGAEETLAVFAKANGCSDGKTTVAYPARDPKETTRAFADKLKGCKAPVELLRIEGGGHTIPGRWPGNRNEAVGPRNADVNAATLIWDFFHRAS